MKSLWKKIRTAIIWRLLWLVSTGIAYTVRTRAIGVEHLDQMQASGDGGVIALWHGATMQPIFFCRHRGLWAIISLSRDGELQNRLVMSRGYQTIRGSSGRAGIKAFLGAVRHVKDGAVIAITPDGPRGPAKVVQLGTVLLAERAECPILPLGIACNRSWRLNSWDKHSIPKPFSKAVIVFGEPLSVEKCDTDEERQVWAEKIADVINQANADAEAELFAREKGNVSAL